MAQELVGIFQMHVDFARTEVPGMLAQGWTLRDQYAAVFARLRLAEDNPDAALRLLAPAINECQRQGRALACLHLELLRAAALHGSGKEAQALRLLIQITEQATTNGLLRPFMSERGFIAPLLPALADAGQRAPIGDGRGWRRLCEILGITGAATANGADWLDRPGEIDPLTDREREMIGFIDAGLSNQEIADRLAISVPTVKWHLHNLFSKMGVRNRSSAVRLARENRII